MAGDAQDRESRPGPSELRDPLVRQEVRRAGVWLGMALAIAVVILLIQPILVIIGAIIFAVILDGGTRLLRRALPIGRGWRLLIVVVSAIGFVAGVIYLAGIEIAAQAGQLRLILEAQARYLIDWAASYGLMASNVDVQSIATQAFSSLGRLTSAIGTVAGAFGSLALIFVIGLFIAMEPRIYDRGLIWLLPRDQRVEVQLLFDRIGYSMRRLFFGRIIGMVFEGIFTWLMLSWGNVPMALLLGLIAGILAFIPNLGALITGCLMVAVGFSAGTDTGLWAVLTYFVVQTFDGYILIPMIARRTVDLPPALTIGAQILFSALFGVLGLALADPIVAAIKVALERRAERTGSPLITGPDGAPAPQ